MATVYLAEDLKHQRKVAVKVLRADLAASLGPERFLREVTIAANLQHPHVLPLYDSGQADGFLYYVMPYVEGVSLRQKLIREGELPIPDAVRILRDMADALAYAHQHGVVHRDIKPENVMLSGRHALVTDFGVAKAVSEATGRQTLTTAGVALGTPAYMAPEQAAADPHTDHRADIYAFGVVAYELLTGRPPFVASTPQAILGAHATMAPDPVTKYRPSISPGLAALVMKCLEKLPADRWQSADELLPRLEAVLTPSGGMTPSATQPISAALVTSKRRRRRLGLAVGGAAVLALAVIGWRVFLRAPAIDADLVLVAPFENKTGSPSSSTLGEELAERLAEKLSAQGVTEPVPAVRVRQLLQRLSRGTGEVGPELARRTGAGILVAGTIYLRGDTLEYHAALLRMPSGERVGVIRPVRAADQAMGESLVAERTATLLAAHAEWGDEIKWGMEYDLPDRLAVYRMFSDALTAGAREWRLSFHGLNAPKDQMVGLLRGVDSLAPAWATGQVYLAQWDGDTGRMKRLLQAPDLLSGNRDQVDLALAQARGQWEQAYQLARRRYAKAPATHAQLLARLAYLTGRFEEVLALEPHQKGASYWTDGTRRSPEWSQYACFSLHALGRHREELKTAQQWRKEFPGSALYAIAAEIQAQAGLRNSNAVEHLVDEALALQPANPSVYVSLNRAEAAAKELTAHGLPQEATKLLARAIAWEQRRLAAGDSSVALFESLSEMMVSARQYEGARLAAEEMLRRTPSSETSPWRRTGMTRFGTAAAALGDTATARRVVAELERSPNSSPTFIGVPWQVASVLAVLGDTAGALLRLRKARSDGDVMAWAHIAWHRDDGLAGWSRDLPAFRQIVGAR